MHPLLIVLSALANVAISTSALASIPEEAWTQLNSSLGGKLRMGLPYDGPCYETYQDGQTAYNLVECALIEANLTQAEALIQDFGSWVNPSFGSCIATGEKCTLSPSMNSTAARGICYQGSVPPVFVDAQSVEDVQMALKFAYEYRLPMTIKNTGHDYRGYSAAPATFAIWTHHIVPTPKYTQEFIPEGGINAGPAVTYGAGQVFDGLYSFLAGYNSTMVGGTCPTVGAAGGYLAGGGYGILTQEHGLAVDNALQIKVVLPNGTYVTTNRYQNQDLFFALRGGGGGTFGIVTEVTSKVILDNKSVTVAALSTTVPIPRPITEIFVNNAVAWASAGITGSIGVREGNSASVIAISSALTISQIQTALEPVTTYFQSVSSTTNPFVPIFLTYSSYYQFSISPISLEFAARGIGNTTITASRLVGLDQFANEQSREALVDVLVQYEYGAMLTPPSNYTLLESDTQGGPGQASVTPAWRTALWHVVHETVYDPADPVATLPEISANMFKTLSQSVNGLRALTPNGGAYMNEGDTYEPDAPSSFWGLENYDRLLSIKKQVDPYNQLSCLKCVGANESAVRNQCYPKIY